MTIPPCPSALAGDQGAFGPTDCPSPIDYLYLEDSGVRTLWLGNRCIVALVAPFTHYDMDLGFLHVPKGLL